MFSLSPLGELKGKPVKWAYLNHFSHFYSFSRFTFFVCFFRLFSQFPALFEWFLSFCGQFGILCPDKLYFAQYVLWCFSAFHFSWYSLLNVLGKVRAHWDSLFCGVFEFCSHFRSTVIYLRVFLGFLIITSIFGMHMFVVVNILFWSR